MTEKRHSIWALNDKETEQLKKAADIIGSVYMRALAGGSNTDEIQFMTLIGNAHSEVKRELKSKRAAISTLRKVADRVLGGSWYEISASVPTGDGKGQFARAVHVDQNGVEKEIIVVSLRINGQTGKWIDPQEHPRFYDATTPEEQHEALGLGNNCKRLARWQEIALATLREAYTQERQARMLTASNTKIRNAASNISRQAIRNAIVNSTYGMITLEAENGIKLNLSSNFYMLKVKELKLQAKGSLLEEMESTNIALGADKLLLQLENKALTAGKEVILTLKEYKEARGLKDSKTAKERMFKEAAFLRSMYFDENDMDDSGYGRAGDSSLLQDCGYISQRGKETAICATFGDKYYDKTIARGYRAQYPTWILRLSRPDAYIIAKAFISQMRTGAISGNTNTLNVATLLPRLSKPAYDDLNDKAQAAQRIIRPFVEDMKEIENVAEEAGDTWCYSLRYSKTHSKTEDGYLTADDAERAERDYPFFVTLKVHVIWEEQPKYDQTKKNYRRTIALNAAKTKGKGRKKKPVKK